MFTGIIQHVGAVRRAEPAPDGRRLVVDVGALAGGLTVGDSVAIDGVCVTATEVQGALAAFDAVAETLGRTNLGALIAGSRVNLERALRVGDGLDGHIVQGHVDGTARVDHVARVGGGREIHFACDGSLTDQMVPKGSVAVDGVSLTLVNVDAGRFNVAVIPTTLGKSTLGSLRGGDEVNVETDVLGKYVRQCLGSSSGGGVTMDRLRQAGFV